MPDYMTAKTSQNLLNYPHFRAEVVLQTWADGAADDEVLGMVVRTGEPSMLLLSHNRAVTDAPTIIHEILHLN